MLVAAAAWFATRPKEEPIAAQDAAAPMPAEEAAPIRPPAETAQLATQTDATRKLQAGLDAIAQAYNDGNAKAAEAALPQNHVVVRPNGEHLDRAGVIEQWEREWAMFQDHELKMVVISAEQQGDRVQASWSVDLTANLKDESGQSHRYEFHGVQNATYRMVDGEERLEGPITYSVFDQTMDGEPWGAAQ